MARKSATSRVANTEPQLPSTPRLKSVNNTLKLRLDDLKTFDPLTENQKLFFEAYKRGDYFVALHGVAGTGKTFCALYKAIEEVMDKANPFDKIIVVRSAVQSREIGHLPGDVNEKMEIYQQPYRQICDTLFGRKDAWDRLEEQGHIEFISTSFIRGMSFDDAIIIVDEMQNMTYEEIDTVMKLGMGHPMGPLELADFIGLDVCLSILEVMYNGFKNPKYAPCPLLVNMVRAGKLGSKSGEGFYDYSESKKAEKIAKQFIS